jgi:hypothetical protein
MVIAILGEEGEIGLAMGTKFLGFRGGNMVGPTKSLV